MTDVRPLITLLAQIIIRETRTDDHARSTVRPIQHRPDEVLGQDIPQSRAVLRDVLGPVRIEDRENGVYAVMKRPAVALLAVAGVSRSGSGGRILDMETEVLIHAH